ncbi:MAG: DUF4920 domain-containing protein [Kofleriaceae bacterium]|nr:DUF4920 domain-containing protein [Kofleriaceae bacterium]
MKKLGLAATLAICLLAACDKSTKSSGASAAKVAPVAAIPAPTTPPAPAAPVAAAPAGEVAGTKYGAGVTQTTTVSVEEVLANPQAYANKPIRVEGMVTDVCPKRGCWFEIAGSKPGQKLRFKVKDGDMVFPMEAKGQFAVAEGVLAVNELTIEQTKSMAEEQAKEYGTAYDPASITKPSTQLRLDGTGAVIRDQK